MERETFIKKLNSKGTRALIFGIILVILGGLMSMGIAMSGIHPVIIIFILIICVGIFLICFGSNYLGGENCRYFKKNPDILNLANDLFVHKIYEDNFVIVSEKALMIKKDVSKIAARTDVLAIYENIQYTNGIPTSHNVNVQLRNGKAFIMNVYAKKRETKDDLVLILSHFCPNAMIGYSPETVAYIQAKRQEYKDQMKNMHR